MRFISIFLPFPIYSHEEDGLVVYPANAFDSCLRDDKLPLGSSPTKSQKNTPKNSAHFGQFALKKNK